MQALPFYAKTKYLVILINLHLIWKFLLAYNKLEGLFLAKYSKDYTPLCKSGKRLYRVGQILICQGNTKSKGLFCARSTRQKILKFSRKESRQKKDTVCYKI